MNPGIRRSIEIRDAQKGLIEISLRATDDITVLEEQVKKAFGSDNRGEEFNIAEIAMEARVPASQSWCANQLKKETQSRCTSVREECELLHELATDSDSIVEAVGVEGVPSSWALVNAQSAPTTSLRVPGYIVEDDDFSWQQKLHWLSVYCGWRFFTHDVTNLVDDLSNRDGTDLLLFSGSAVALNGDTVLQSLLDIQQLVRKYIVVQTNDKVKAPPQTWVSLNNDDNDDDAFGEDTSDIDGEVAAFCHRHTEWKLDRRTANLIILKKRRVESDISLGSLVPRLWLGIKMKNGQSSVVDVQPSETVKEATIRNGEVLHLTPPEMEKVYVHLRRVEQMQLEEEVVQAKRAIAKMEEALASLKDPRNGGGRDITMMSAYHDSNGYAKLGKRLSQSVMGRTTDVLSSRINHYHKLLLQHMRDDRHDPYPEVVYSMLATSEMPLTGVLQNEEQLNDSLNALHRLGLQSHPHRIKSWDLHLMTEAVLRVLSPHEQPAIFNMGAGSGDNLLLNLARLGFKKLYACELIESRNIHLHARDTHVETSEQDLQQTNFPTNMFHAVMSVSVIEHDVDIPRYFREANRLLKTGGILLTSCDYWPNKVDTSSVPLDLNVFSREEILGFTNQETLKSFGFKLVVKEDMKWNANKTMIHFFGKKYTFAMLTMVKFNSIPRAFFTQPIIPNDAAQIQHLHEFRSQYPNAQLFGMSAFNPMYLPKEVFMYIDHVTWAKTNTTQNFEQTKHKILKDFQITEQYSPQ